MKRLLISLVLATLAVGSAYAADGGAMSPQQRMKECAPMTKGMSKEQRSAFMKQCLSKAGHEAAMAGHKTLAMSNKGMMQKQKMKDCNAKAKDGKMSGADRKAFMQRCLKGGS